MIVPEVQIGLQRISTRECATAQVMNHRSGAGVDFVSLSLYPPTQIDLFLVCEEKGVESADLMKHS
jgi:hypothetical protein